MIINKDYKFRDDIEQDTIPIEILIDPFKGVVYRYTKVEIKENKDNTATMKFQFDLLETGTKKENDLRNDLKFNELIGIILNQLILDKIEEEVKTNPEIL